MNNANVLNLLTRLAQIAEELDQTNPTASELIDDTIEDVAKNFPAESKEETPIAQDLYPKVETPVATDFLSNEDVSAESLIPESADIEDTDDIAQQIVDELLNSEQFQALLPDLREGRNTDALHKLIHQKIEETTKI